jgi:hypothetical protein
MALDDRPRGILSEADRRYLRNPEEYSKQAGYERRQAIIERVHEALHDFPLLVSELDKESRFEAFEDREKEGEASASVLPSAFAFLYLGLIHPDEPADLVKDTYEGLVGQGIKEAYLQRGVTVRNVTVDIEIETGPPIEELREQGDLHLFEIFQMIEAGELPAEEATELLNELMQERGDETLGDEFQGAAASFPVDIFVPLFEQPEEESDVYDPTKEFEDG